MLKYLALGDSYTIGETLEAHDNFPNQLVQQLVEKNISLQLVETIAKTGWTTDELANAIYERKPNHDYDWVTLLIGVNNQYRERSVDEYAWQFYSLLCQAILFAKGNSQHVIVLSIPDWGLTPFNTARDKQMTSLAIDKLNEINKKTAVELSCHYIDVTASTRLHAVDKSFLATDMLHYSKLEYAVWANEIVSIIAQQSK
jgi:lysophospholipase L1-like esterase